MEACPSPADLVAAAAAAVHTSGTPEAAVVGSQKLAFLAVVAVPCTQAWMEAGEEVAPSCHLPRREKAVLPLAGNRREVVGKLMVQSDSLMLPEPHHSAADRRAFLMAEVPRWPLECRSRQMQLPGPWRLDMLGLPKRARVRQRRSGE